MARKKQSPVQGFIFNTSDEHELAERNGTVCQIRARSEESGVEILEFGPQFIVEFGDGFQTAAYAYELSPWFQYE